MSRRILRYVDGRPEWGNDDGGARARVTVDQFSGRGFVIGGAFVVPESPASNEAEAKRRYRETHKAEIIEKQREYRRLRREGAA